MTILVVGAGLSGATVARVLAEAGKRVVVIESRHHVAGNAYDYINPRGIRIHQYGPHIFHTKNEDVWKFLGRFTGWMEYEHWVTAVLHDGYHVPFPPNDVTRNHVPESQIIDTFYRPYTEKMWGKKLESVSPKILERVPGRQGLEWRYFPDATYQGMPRDGYTQMVQNMLDHHNISVRLKTPYHHVVIGDYEHVFNSQAIDAYFNFSLGMLPYRSIRFTTVDVPTGGFALFSPVVNFTDTGRFTRVTEWKQFPDHDVGGNPWTTLTYEEPYSPAPDEEKFYPVVDNASRALYKQYVAQVPEWMTFIGRLGNFAYLDMDAAVNSALATARRYLQGQSVKEA